MIYTSGSTGKPKGVTVTHANVVRLLEAAKPWFDFSHRDVWSLFHTYSFDVSVWEMWGCLLTGGRLVVVPYWVSRSPQEFHALLAKEQVTVLCQTPVAFYQLIEAEEAGAAALSELRYVILAGEALNFANLRPWLTRHGDAKPQIINMYGPTEATVYSTYRRVAAVDIENETRSLIGVPLLDANIYILDSKERPVPPGVAGELCIAGAGVARGYLNRPELTAERFVPDPFVNRAGARMYKSGDLARFVAQGDIDFLGRLDNQVKIHGFRIELGEIEAILAQHPDVREITVAARKDGPGDKKLVAYFVTRSGSSISGAELREFLQAKIPAHMIPYAYVQLEALPLNPSGKVDRAKFPAPDTGSAARTREYLPPRTPEEKILTDILSEVLRIERVGVTDNLFELGADSLHVFQITSRAAKAGLTISPRLLLQQRTIAGVVAEMGDSQASIASPSPSIKPVARQKYKVTRETQQVETNR
jgi:amino acid adenylation domain-containing protein